MWVKPRKVNEVPFVSGWSVPFGRLLRKSTKRVLSGWSVSPYRARRLPKTPRTRLASKKSSNASTASSAKRIRIHLPLRRERTSNSNHSSSTWCRKMFERQGETLWGAFGRVVQKAILQDSRFQPLINHPSDHTIRDSLVKKVSKVGVRNRIEVFYDVDI